MAVPVRRSVRVFPLLRYGLRELAVRVRSTWSADQEVRTSRVP